MEERSKLIKLTEEGELEVVGPKDDQSGMEKGYEQKNGFSKLWVEGILRRFGPSVVGGPWGVAGRETPRSGFQIRIVKGKSGPTI